MKTSSFHHVGACDAPIETMRRHLNFLRLLAATSAIGYLALWLWADARGLTTPRGAAVVSSGLLIVAVAAASLERRRFDEDDLAALAGGGAEDIARRHYAERTAALHASVEWGTFLGLFATLCGAPTWGSPALLVTFASIREALYLWQPKINA